VLTLGSEPARERQCFLFKTFILEFGFRTFDIEPWLLFHQVGQVYKILRVYMLDT